MLDPCDIPRPPLPSEEELARDRDAFNAAIGWRPPPGAKPPAAAPVNPAETDPPALAADPIQTSASASPHRIDWGQVAVLLAEGQSVEAAAAAQGCHPKVILRNLRRSQKFRRRIEAAHERRRLSTQLRFNNMGELAVQYMRTGRMDAKMLQWLGDRLGLRHFGSPADIGVAERWQVAVRPELAQRNSAPAEQKPRIIDQAGLDAILKDADTWEEGYQAGRRATLAAQREEFQLLRNTAAGTEEAE